MPPAMPGENLLKRLPNLFARLYKKLADGGRLFLGIGINGSQVLFNETKNPGG